MYSFGTCNSDLLKIKCSKYLKQTLNQILDKKTVTDCRLFIYKVNIWFVVCTSSATAMSTNSNCCLVATVRTRWSRMCSRVAAMSISFAPFAMRFRTMSIRQYVPVRPAPSLCPKMYYCSNIASIFAKKVRVEKSGPRAQSRLNVKGKTRYVIHANVTR